MALTEGDVIHVDKFEDLLSKTSNSSNYNSALDDSVVYHTEKRTVEYKGPTVAGGGAAITGTPSEDVVVKNEETKSVGSGGTLTK